MCVFLVFGFVSFGFSFVHTHTTPTNTTTAIRGSDLRSQADAMVIHYMPLVTDETREQWETYALEHRFQIDKAFHVDTTFRQEQDKEFGFNRQRQVLEESHASLLSSSSMAVDRTGVMVVVKEEEEDKEDNNNNTNVVVWDDNIEMDLEILRGLKAGGDDNSNGGPTILDDGTGFHPKVWNFKGDEVNGNGPYIPLWQRRYVYYKPTCVCVAYNILLLLLLLLLLSFLSFAL